MQHRRVWFWALGGLAATWLLAAGVWAWAGAIEVTPERVVAYLEDQPLEGLADPERAAVIDGLAERINRLSFDDRRDPELNRQVRQTFFAMTPDERDRYLDRTLPKGFTQMMEAINAMPAEEREQLVDNALADLKKAERDRPWERSENERLMDDAAVQRIVDEGMRSYLRDANSETKLALKPLIEQMQQMMQRARR